MSSRERLWHVMEMTSKRRGTQSPALNIPPPAHPVAADSKKEMGDSRWIHLVTEQTDVITSPPACSMT
jgi:hypothetical protein